MDGGGGGVGVRKPILNNGEQPFITIHKTHVAYQSKRPTDQPTVRPRSSSLHLAALFPDYADKLFSSCHKVVKLVKARTSRREEDCAVGQRELPRFFNRSLQASTDVLDMAGGVACVCELLADGGSIGSKAHHADVVVRLQKLKVDDKNAGLRHRLTA